MRPSRTHGDHIHQGMAVSPLPQGHTQGGQKTSAAACVEPRTEGAAPEGAPAPSCLPCACMPTHVLGLDASQLNAAPALVHAFFLLSLPALGQLPRTEAGDVRAGSRSGDGDAIAGPAPGLCLPREAGAPCSEPQNLHGTERSFQQLAASPTTRVTSTPLGSAVREAEGVR